MADQHRYHSDTYCMSLISGLRMVMILEKPSMGGPKTTGDQSQIRDCCSDTWLAGLKKSSTRARQGALLHQRRLFMESAEALAWRFYRDLRPVAPFTLDEWLTFR